MDTIFDLKIIKQFKNKKIIIFSAIFVAIWVVLFIKCKYGYANLDETYYLSLTHRIAQGDALIVEEWHPSQLFSYLLLPVMYVYSFIFGNSEGIVLFFRYLYVFVWGIACYYLFFALKKITNVGAMISSLMLLIYAPYGITALSYNTLGILFLTLSCVIHVTKDTNISSMISGTFYSFSVICCPFLAILLIYLIPYYLCVKKDKKQLLYFLLGVFIQFIVFMLFILSRTNISSIMKSIPNIVNNPEYNNINIFVKLKKFLSSFYYNGNKYVLIAISILTLLSYCSKHKEIYLLFIVILDLLLLIYMFNTYHYLNHLMFPLAIFVPFLFQFKNKDIRKIIYSIWIPGIIYSICLNISSDQVSYAVFSGLSIASVGSVCALCLYLKNNKNLFINAAKILLVFIIVLQLSFELNIRWNHSYWESDIKEQTILLDKGPEKGIYVSEDKRNTYSIIMAGNESFKFNCDTILFLTNEPLYYLSNFDIRSSAYASWMCIEPTLQMNYFDINPHKIPDIIYYPSIEKGSYDEVLKALIDRYGYQMIDFNDCGFVYAR